MVMRGFAPPPPPGNGQVKQTACAADLSRSSSADLHDVVPQELVLIHKVNRCTYFLKYHVHENI